MEEWATKQGRAAELRFLNPDDRLGAKTQGIQMQLRPGLTLHDRAVCTGAADETFGKTDQCSDATFVTGAAGSGVGWLSPATLATPCAPPFGPALGTPSPYIVAGV